MLEQKKSEIKTFDYEASKQNLMRILKESKLTIADLSEALGLQYHTIWKWTKGVDFPGYDNLVSLIDFLGDVKYEDIIAKKNIQN